MSNHAAALTELQAALRCTADQLTAEGAEPQLVMDIHSFARHIEAHAEGRRETMFFFDQGNAPMIAPGQPQHRGRSSSMSRQSA